MDKEPRGIYIRVSTEDQAADDKASIPGQKRGCLTLCERQDYEIFDIYVDAADYVATQGRAKGKIVSPSSKRKDRPEYLRMVEDIKAGKIKGVVAWKWDRLGAGPGIYPLMDAIEEAPHPIAIETITEGEISPLMLSMLTSFRAQLLKDMHDRLMMGGKARLENGKFWSGNRLYGYDMVDGKRVVNEYEAEWVRKIFEWYTGGVLVVEIRKRLITGKAKQKGHSSTKRPWNENVIREIIRNPAYTGKVAITWDSQIYELPYEPIVDKKTFRQAQAIMARNRTWPDRNVKSFYLLRGLLRCAHCDGLWTSAGKRYRYDNGKRTERKTPLRSYRCRKGAHYPNECPYKTPIKAEVLEEAVWQEISQLLKDPRRAWTQIQEQIAELNENRAEREKEAGKLKGKLEGLQEERKWLILQARKGMITQVDFEMQIAMMDTEQSELEFVYREALQDIPDELETQKLERLAQTFFENCQANLAWLDNPPKEEWQRAMDIRREIVATLIEEIIIDPERKTMRLKGVFDRVVQFNIEQPTHPMPWPSSISHNSHFENCGQEGHFAL